VITDLYFPLTNQHEQTLSLYSRLTL